MSDEDGVAEEFWPAETWREVVDVDVDVDVAHGRQESSESPKVNLEGQKRKDGLGIWHLLMDDLDAEDWDGWVVDGKWCVSYYLERIHLLEDQLTGIRERISNFLAVPMAVEKVPYSPRRTRLQSTHAA